MQTKPVDLNWYSERQRYVGGSEVAAIMGVDKYRSPMDVYKTKTGEVPPQIDNRHTIRGRTLESFAALEFEETTGIRLDNCADLELRDPELPLRGHLDRRAMDGTIIEIKCPSLGSFRRIQREGIPDSWRIQMQTYLMLAKASNGIFAIFCADQWELKTIDGIANTELWTPIREAVKNFWECVEKRTPPATPDPLAGLQTASTTITRTDPEFVAAAQFLREARQLRDDGEAVYKIASDQMRELIEGKPGRYEGGGVRLYFDLAPGRRTFDRKALEAAHPELDLEPFFKVGKPYEVFRPIFGPGEKGQE